VTHSWTHTPVLKSIPKSDVLVKMVAVRRNITPAKRNGPRRLVLRPFQIRSAGYRGFRFVQKSGHPANQNFTTKVVLTSAAHAAY